LHAGPIGRQAGNLRHVSAHRQTGREFKARISSTDPVYTAEILEPFQGAEVILNVNRPVLLFDDVVIRIENVDLATAKIHATLAGKEDEQ